MRKVENKIKTAILLLLLFLIGIVGFIVMRNNKIFETNTPKNDKTKMEELVNPGEYNSFKPIRSLEHLGESVNDIDRPIFNTTSDATGNSIYLSIVYWDYEGNKVVDRVGQMISRNSDLDSVIRASLKNTTYSVYGTTYSGSSMLADADVCNIVVGVMKQSSVIPGINFTYNGTSLKRFVSDSILAGQTYDEQNIINTYFHGWTTLSLVSSVVQVNSSPGMVTSNKEYPLNSSASTKRQTYAYDLATNAKDSIGSIDIGVAAGENVTDEYLLGKSTNSKYSSYKTNGGSVAVLATDSTLTIPVYKEYTATIKLYNEDTNLPLGLEYTLKILGGFVYNPSEFQFKAPTGYEYSRCNTTGDVTCTGDQTWIYYYKSTLKPFTIHYYKDGTTTIIKPDYTSQAYMGTVINVSTYNSITGYTFKKATNSSGTQIASLTIGTSNNIINMYFTPNKYTYTINYYLLNTTTEIKTARTGTLDYGSELKLVNSDKIIDGYAFSKAVANGKELSDGEGITIGTDTSKNVIKVYFTSTQYGYTINYYKEGTTTQLQASRTGTANQGTTVSPQTSDKKIVGYTYKNATNYAGATVTSITITSNTAQNVMNLYFAPTKYAFTINYYRDGTTTKLQTSRTGTQDYDSDLIIQESDKQISGYVYKNATDYSGAGITNSIKIGTNTTHNVINLYFTYSQYNYTINYLLQSDGSTIKSPEKHTAEYKSVIKIRDIDKNLDGYVYVKATNYNNQEISINSGLTIGTDESQNIINLYYTIAECTLTINHYKDGTTTKLINISPKVGVRKGAVVTPSSYAQNITGYTYKEARNSSNAVITSLTVNSDSTVNLYYTINQYNFTINFYEVDKTEPIRASITDRAEYGSEIQASSYSNTQIENYIYDHASVNKITIGVNESENQINLYYTKKHELDRIEVTNPPNIDTYKVGENFDKTGMEVTAYYTDETHAVVTNYEIEGGQNLTKSVTSLTIKYTENGITRTTTQAITVRDKLTIRFKTYGAITKNNKKFIVKVAPKTTVQQVKDDIETNGTITIEETSIKTGVKVTISLDDEMEEYIIAVKGDTNGDGEADLRDIFQMNKHRLNKVLLQDEFAQAADANRDNLINISDIFLVNKYRQGKGTL